MSWTLLLLLGALLLYLLPMVLCGLNVLNTHQPRVWVLLFLCMPLLGPLLYLLWPRGGLSRPWPARLRP